MLALLCFGYVVLAGILQGAEFSPLLQHALIALVVYFLFGALVGQIGESVVVEDLIQADLDVQADLIRIQKETEEISGVARFRARGVSVETQELVAGQILEEAVKNAAGEILLEANRPVTEGAIRRFIEEGVRRVKVKT